jgi:hypothetical protein
MCTHIPGISIRKLLQSAKRYCDPPPPQSAFDWSGNLEVAEAYGPASHFFVVQEDYYLSIKIPHIDSRNSTANRENLLSGRLL